MKKIYYILSSLLFLLILLFFSFFNEGEYFGLENNERNNTYNNDIIKHHTRLSKSNYLLNYHDFFQIISKWKESDPKNTINDLKVLSFPQQFIEYDPHIKIIKSLNVAALPYLHEIIKNIDDDVDYFQNCCYYLFIDISKVSVTYNVEDGIKSDNFGIVHREFNLRENIYNLSQWWRYHYLNDIAQFEDLYSKYQSSQNNDKKQLIFEQIKKIGIRILPNIMNKLFECDWSMLTIADYYTNDELAADRNHSNFDALTEQEKKQWIMNWWKRNKDIYSLDYKLLYDLID